MHGLRVVPIFRYRPESLTDAGRAARPDGVRRDDASEFALFFGRILPALDHLAWLADENAFRFPPDWGGEYDEVDRRRTWVAQSGDGRSTLTVDPNWILGPGFVSAYARHANDDWNSLYGFTSAPDDWRSWMRRRFDGEPAERAAFLAATVEVCFFSVDGAYWEFFARDARLVERVRQGLDGCGGLRLEGARLADSAGV
jgi:hypothetical protein